MKKVFLFTLTLLTISQASPYKKGFIAGGIGLVAGATGALICYKKLKKQNSMLEEMSSAELDKDELGEINRRILFSKIGLGLSGAVALVSAGVLAKSFYDWRVEVESEKYRIEELERLRRKRRMFSLTDLGLLPPGNTFCINVNGDDGRLRFTEEGKIVISLCECNEVSFSPEELKRVFENDKESLDKLFKFVVEVYAEEAKSEYGGDERKKEFLEGLFGSVTEEICLIKKVAPDDDTHFLGLACSVLLYCKSRPLDHAFRHKFGFLFVVED